MTKQPGRADLIIGSVLLTTALTFSHVTHLPLYLFAPLIIVGLVLLAEGAATMHNDQEAIRLERTMAVQKKLPPMAITQPGIPRNVKALVWDWAGNRAPTTRRYAEETHQVTQDQWQRTVDWAVRHGLGELVPGEGGNKKLRWTASINEALNLLDGLGAIG